MIVAEIPPDIKFYWTDQDHFVHGDCWYRLVQIGEQGCLQGEFFWIDAYAGEVHKSTVITAAGFAESRPAAETRGGTPTKRWVLPLLIGLLMGFLSRYV